MKRILSKALVFGLWLVHQPAWAQTAGEKAEKRLAELLAPGAKMSMLAFATEPLPWKGTRVVEDFAVLPIKPYVGMPVRLPEPARQPVKPRAVPEGLALASYREQPAVPKDVELPAKPLIRLPSVDIHRPVPIPILAQPQKDRASLADPTLETSLDVALKPLVPTRSQPVPFTPLNLPDPFEFLRSGQLRNPPEENPVPPVIPLQKPAR